jgi:hypothetical protein
MSRYYTFLIEKMVACLALGLELLLIVRLHEEGVKIRPIQGANMFPRRFQDVPNPNPVRRGNTLDG